MPDAPAGLGSAEPTPAPTIPGGRVDVSVVIPTWNGWSLLRPCLEALGRQTLAGFETLVVDDGSTDSTADLVRTEFGSRIRVIRNAENRGFAVSMNRGFRAAAGDWLVALNNDTVPEPEFLTEMVTAAKQGFDMIAAKVVLRDGRGIDSAGVVPYKDGSSEERYRDRPASEPGVNREEDVFGPSAAAALYSRRILRAAGEFDEDFFAYYEDVDLAWRGRLAGGRCRYIPRAVVRHHHSATWGRVSRRKLFLLERNRLWTLWKNYPAALVIGEPVHHLERLREIRRSAYLAPEAREQLAAIGVGSVAGILLRAQASAYRQWPRMWKKRREVRRRKVVTDVEIASWLI
jgi:GT2 family glycosyltransferase